MLAFLRPGSERVILRRSRTTAPAGAQNCPENAHVRLLSESVGPDGLHEEGQVAMAVSGSPGTRRSVHGSVTDRVGSPLDGGSGRPTRR